MTAREFLNDLYIKCAMSELNSVMVTKQGLDVLKQALTELEELKATVKELLDIPITVSTVSGTSLLIKTMNKLEKLVGDKDE